MKKLLLILALTGLMPAFADLNLDLPDLNLPSLGGQNSSFTSSYKERQLGKHIIRKLRSSNQIIEDPEINSWIRAIGNKLTATAPQSSSPFYFLVSNKPSINAYATQGGVIVIHAGLILRTSSESELAAVISHEIAHVTQHHISRMLNKQKNNKLATSAALVAGVFAASKDPQAGQAIISTTIASIAHKQLTFNREAEAEADRVGIRILARAGYDPQGMPTFLNKLEQFADSKSAQSYEYLRSHPLTIKRVIDTEVRAKQLRSRKVHLSDRYFYMREKVRALSKSNQTSPANIPNRVKRYSKSLLLEQKRNYSSSLNIIGTKTNNPVEAVLIAKLLNTQHQYNQTIQLLTPLVRIYPEDISLYLPLSRAYVGSSQFEEAWKILNSIEISEQTSLEFFEVQQNVAQLTRRPSNAFHAAANKNMRIGAYKSAASQLRRAIKLQSSSSDFRELQQQLTEVEELIRSTKNL